MEQILEIAKIDQNELLEDLLDAIDEMDAQEAGIITNNAEAYVIDTPQQANYAIRKVKEIRKQMDDIHAMAKQELASHEAKVKEWEAKQVLSLEYSEQYFASRLEGYAHTHIDANGKKKSLSLIDGSIGFRKVQDSYDYDDKALIDGLKGTHDELIEMKPAVKKAELKKAATVKEGKLYLGDMLVPGVTVTAQPDKFEVK